MAERANPDIAEQVGAAFAWWRDAGVDCHFEDEPADWIAPPPPMDASGRLLPPVIEPIAVAASAPALPVIDLAGVPQDLDAFAAWWLTEPALDDGRLAGRVAPRGSEGADVMVIVAEPEREDGDTLLSAREGALLDAMLSAMGIASERVYFASALPRHTPMADWSEMTRLGIGRVLASHVTLVKPRRIIAFGSNVLSLLNNAPPNSGQIVREFKHEGASIPLFAAAELGVLLARPRVKGRLWQQWLDWTGIETA